MTNCHCSKCCPVTPPVPDAPWIPPWGVYLWGAGLVVAVVGVWSLLVWIGSSIWP